MMKHRRWAIIFPIPFILCLSYILPLIPHKKNANLKCKSANVIFSFFVCFCCANVVLATTLAQQQQINKRLCTMNLMKNLKSRERLSTSLWFQIVLVCLLMFYYKTDVIGEIWCAGLACYLQPPGFGGNLFVFFS